MSNHKNNPPPRRTSRVKARPSDAIRNLADVDRLRKYLIETYEHGRLYANICTIGFNTGLRISDILGLRLCDVIDIADPAHPFRTHISVKEIKTGKSRTILINKAFREVLESLSYQFMLQTDTAPIFSSSKTFRELQNKALHKIIKHALRNLGVRGNFGTHTLRKTWAYHVYQETKNIEIIQHLLNHSDLSVTRLYLPKDTVIEIDPDKMKHPTDDEIYAKIVI